MSTLLTLQTNVANELGLSVDDDATSLTKWLNDGVTDVLLRTRCYVAVATMTLTAGFADYALPASPLAVSSMSIASSGTGYPMEATSATELKNLRLNATASSPARLYAIDGADLLLIYPSPSSADIITIYYTPTPTPMSAAGNDPSTATYGGIPAAYHVGIELYAMWKAGSASDDQSSAQGEKYRIQYEGQNGHGGWIRDTKRQMLHLQGSRLPRARVSGRGRFLVRHDNSQYP